MGRLSGSRVTRSSVGGAVLGARPEGLPFGRTSEGLPGGAAVAQAIARITVNHPRKEISEARCAKLRLAGINGEWG